MRCGDVKRTVRASHSFNRHFVARLNSGDRRIETPSTVIEASRAAATSLAHRFFQGAF
jgi:hypothetical protein